LRAAELAAAILRRAVVLAASAQVNLGEVVVSRGGRSRASA
jgi:hypothetical protein